MSEEETTRERIKIKHYIEDIWNKVDDIEKKLSKNTYICTCKIGKEVAIENLSKD